MQCITKVFFEEIRGEGISVETSFAIEEEEERLRVESFIGSVTKAAELFLLRGNLRALYLTLCDRCAESLAIPIDAEVSIAVKRGAPPAVSEDYENADEDGEIYYTTEEYLDLVDLLRQEALLALPYGAVCEKCSSFIDIEDNFDGEKATPFKKLEKLKAAITLTGSLENGKSQT